MTTETLIFLRGLLDRVTLQVADPNFRADAESIIAALAELDKEIADANDPSRSPLHDIHIS